MSYTIPQIPVTALNVLIDDFVELGGISGGSRKLLASSFVLTTDPRLSALGTVTSVSASGGATGLSFTGSPITETGTLLLAGTLAPTSGGTGNTTYAVGDLIQASSSTALARLAAVAAGNVLLSGGVNTVSSWGKVGIGTHVSGLGTGIAAALAVSTGSAGAPVLFNGALGTPTGGNASNLTALNASQLTSGTVPDGRFPATLPATSGANLTALNASQLTSGTVSNARTTATSANTINTIVARDGSGNFAAGVGTFTALTAANALRATSNATTDTPSSALDYIAGKARVWSWGPDVSTLGTFAVRLASSNGVTASEPLTVTSTGTTILGTLSASGQITGNLTGTVTGNAATATKLSNPRTIAITGDLAYTSPNFDGTDNVTAAGTLATVATAGTTGSSTAIPVITINAKGLTTSVTTAVVVAPAGTLSGTTLAAGVTASSLTSVGTLAGLTVTAAINGSVTGSSGSTTGNAATATKLITPRAINGVNFDGSADITVTAAASTLTGTTLAAGVTGSSLTSVGTLAGLTVTAAIAGSVTGSSGSTTGNAATATALQNARLINGVSFNGTGDITIPNLASVENRAALRALTGALDGQVVFEDGYYKKGDGGGGFWYFDLSDNVSVDNDGTRVVPLGVYGTTASVGCWHRSKFGRQTSTICNTEVINVRWFGAGASSDGAEIYADSTLSVTRAFNTALGRSNALYFPSGAYPFRTMLVLDAAGNTFNLFGDGPSTVIAYAFGNANVVTNYCMWHLKQFSVGSQIRDFYVSNDPIYADQNYPLSIIRVTEASGCSIKNITMRNMMTDGTSPGITYAPNSVRSQTAGGSLWVESGTAITVENIFITKNFGTALCIGGGSTGSWPSVRLSKCWLFQDSVPILGAFANGVMGVKPTLWIASGDTLQVDNLFVENGGPYRAFPSSSIASFGSYFVVTTPTAHNFEAGDYIVINGATNTAYNHRWRIRSVTATTIRIESAVSGTEASVYCTSLFVCCLFGGGISPIGNQNSVAESMITYIYTNQGGRLVEGSVGLYLCARKSTAGTQGFMAGLLLSNLFSDFGESTLFIHGTPSADSSAGAILCTNVRANGGPRSPFGGVRVEIGNRVTINAPFMEASLTAFAGSLITPNPGTGNWPYSPITAMALSDGGADNATVHGIKDIAINGGILQDTFRSSQLAGNGLVSTALSVDGSRISNIRSTGSLVDLISANSTPLLLTNGATEDPGKVLVDFWPGRILNASILSGNAILSILQAEQVKLIPETDYPTGSSIELSFAGRTSIYIPLATDPIFSSSASTLASGNYIFLALKNTAGGSLTLTWPGAWSWAGVSTPTTLASGASLLLRIFAFGTTDSSVIASY